jgi:hypothetical protein
MASPLRYNVKNSAASLSSIRVACTYAYILKIKFSVSLCLPLKVIGFSYLMLTGYYYITYYYCGYWPLDAPASATAYYDCYYYSSNVVYYGNISLLLVLLFCTPNYDYIPLLRVDEVYARYSCNKVYASAANYYRYNSSVTYYYYYNYYYYNCVYISCQSVYTSYPYYYINYSTTSFSSAVSIIWTWG